MKYYFCLLFIIVQTSLFASGIATPLDKQILELSFNFEFEEAEMLVDKQLAKYPDNLKYHYLFINTKLLKIIKISDDTPYKNKSTVKDSLHKELIEYGEKIIEKYGDNDLSIEERYYIASIYGMLGRMYGLERSWMSAFSNGKTGRNMLEEIIREDAQFADAYLLLGILNYYADRLDGVVGIIATILGLSGDRDVGIQYMKLAEKHGVFTKAQAAMLLIELHARLERNSFEALPLFEKFIKEFPGNSHFINWYCRELMDLLMLDKVDKLIKNDSRNLINDQVKARYYHLIGEYELSNDLLDKLLAEEGLLWPWVYEYYKSLRVQNHIMLGNIEQAEKLKKDLNERHSKTIDSMLNKPFISRWLVKLREQISSNKDKTVIESMIANPEIQSAEPYLQAVYYYYLGIFYFKNKNYKEAAKNFILAKTNNPERFKYMTSVYLLRIYKLIDADIQNVEMLLDDIDELDNDALGFSALDLERKYGL